MKERLQAPQIIFIWNPCQPNADANTSQIKIVIFKDAIVVNTSIVLYSRYAYKRGWSFLGIPF